MDKSTQRSKIIGYCNEHGSITIRDAFIKLHINSPTKRISEIRRPGSGYNVVTIPERNVNAAGEAVKYMRYFISRTESRAE